MVIKSTVTARRPEDLTSYLPGRLANDGTVARQAGHQWVVSVYHLWENRFRAEIAADRGLNSMRDLKNQHMADLAKIRHDLLKCRGFATTGNTGKCLALKWFNVGDEILIQDWMVYEFMEAFGVVYPGAGEIDWDRVRYTG